jgi:hypothetical protein
MTVQVQRDPSFSRREFWHGKPIKIKTSCKDHTEREALAEEKCWQGILKSMKNPNKVNTNKHGIQYVHSQFFLLYVQKK